jgi:hypothetical protein
MIRGPRVAETAEIVNPRSADELRDAMTDKLIADGWITSPVVERRSPI